MLVKGCTNLRISLEIIPKWVLGSKVGVRCRALKYSAVSPWRVDPDNIQVAEVDAFFIIPIVTGAAFGPDMS